MGALALPRWASCFSVRKARLRGQIAALVGKQRYDLAGRKMGELRVVGGGQNLGALLICELIRRNPALCPGLASISLYRPVLSPALHGARREFENLAGFD